MKYEKKLLFTIEGLPPSYNVAFKINHRLRQTYLSPEARKYKDRIALSMPNWKLPSDKIYIFNIDIEYYSKWKYNNKNIKKKDLQNLNKLLIDGIFKVLGRDDCFIWSITEKKMPSPVEDYYEEDMTRVELEVVSEYEKGE